VRDRFFRGAALVLGVLGIPSLIFQVYRQWPPSELGLEFYGLQALVLLVFITYGTGFAYRPIEGRPALVKDDQSLGP